MTKSLIQFQSRKEAYERCYTNLHKLFRLTKGIAQMWNSGAEATMYCQLWTLLSTISCWHLSTPSTQLWVSLCTIIFGQHSVLSSVDAAQYHLLRTTLWIIYCGNHCVPSAVHTFLYHCLWTLYHQLFTQSSISCGHHSVPLAVDTIQYHNLWTPLCAIICRHHSEPELLNILK
jgi:hypothetical protein